MVIEAILTIISVAAIAGIVNLFGVGDKNVDKISFKETFDLLNAPVISFMYGNRKLHFLLDTGSSLSHIKPCIVESLNISKKDVNGNIISANGVISSNSTCTIPLKYKEKEYTANFIITQEIEDSLELLKKEYNINIHGILGCDFFDKYNYVIDFKELIAYSKK